ncbi:MULTISPECIES: hypothetical protein [unclassified Pseudomonas]|uniref:hypothetical protein n=1 Tax=unclassified Pseudomonas TaxID=196821 RepID=UPI001430A80A|nr:MULTISPECIES: hypothetical protein [unclassified Pseudomonas]
MSRLTVSAKMGLASVWVAWGFLTVGVLGWSLFVVLKYFGIQDDAPGWVQAIGSIGAILAAGAVPAWQRRIEAKRKDADQLQQQIADCFQLRRLIQEMKHLLNKGVDSENVFGSKAPLVEIGVRDILQRLSSLEMGRSDKVLLKSTYDVRLIALDFLGMISPRDMCGLDLRFDFECQLEAIHEVLHPYILSLEKAFMEIDVNR